jgi:hypothetical protein
MRDWHTYSILWEKDNATFLVDGEVIETFDTVPSTRMAAVVFVSNYAVRGSTEQSPTSCSYVPIDTASDEWIQVDYVHMFGVPEACVLPVLGLIMAQLIHKAKPGYGLEGKRVCHTL